jgi:integrase
MTVIRTYAMVQNMELTSQTPESFTAAAGALTPQNTPTPAENVRAWWKKARRVYPEATLRAWRFDWTAFLAFCRPRGLLPLPASPSTIAAFIEACGEASKKPATVRRYLATIACAHRAAKILNPNDDEDVKMALKGLYNRSPKRQRQAKALGWHEIKRFLITAGANIRADRERALIAVAYDTMARRSELVAMDVEDFSFMEDGSGRLIIRRSKTDQQGEGSLAYLSSDTVEYLQAWLKPGKWALNPSGGDSGYAGAEHRSRVGDAGGALEDDGDADAVWGGSPGGAWRHGEDGKRARPHEVN